MKKINLLRTIAAVSALIFYSQGVRAKELTEMPKEFIGQWYYMDSKGHSVQESDSSVSFGKQDNGTCSTTVGCEYTKIERKSDGSVDYADWATEYDLTDNDRKNLRKLKIGKHFLKLENKQDDGKRVVQVEISSGVSNLKIDSKGFLIINKDTKHKLTKKPPKF